MSTYLYVTHFLVSFFVTGGVPGELWPPTDQATLDGGQVLQCAKPAGAPSQGLLSHGYGHMGRDLGEGTESVALGLMLDQ